MNKNIFIVSHAMNFVVPVFVLVAFLLVYARVINIGNNMEPNYIPPQAYNVS